ncbi:MAG: metalloregulator ArsR/SmtB family transcription factor [Thermodesulfobacteriota bacterium]
MNTFIKTVKALSDPSRVKIVKLLQRRWMCACEIQEALGLAQSTVSRHLKILEDASLILSSRDGLWVNYRPSEGGENPYAASLLGNLRHWLEDDEAVKELVRRLPGIRREKMSAACKPDFGYRHETK